MIRFFGALCKATLEHLSDESACQSTADGFKRYSGRCPGCGAVGKLTSYGNYSRALVSYGSGKASDSRIFPLRFECSSCGKTHALLAGNLVPYSPYSLRFMIIVLVAYFERETTVHELCGQFGIAVSTLYSWKRRLLEHKELALGALLSLKTPALDFLKGLLKSDRISDYLSGFLGRFGFSFMQNRVTKAAQSHPP